MFMCEVYAFNDTNNIEMCKRYTCYINKEDCVKTLTLCYIQRNMRKYIKPSIDLD